MLPSKKSQSKKRKVEMMDVLFDDRERPGKRIKELATNISSPLLPTSEFASVFEQPFPVTSLPHITENILTPSEFADEFECAICQEMYLKPHTLQCSHTFCKKCINHWCKEKKSCPTCRKNLTVQPIYNLSLDKVIQLVLRKQTVEEQEEMEIRMRELETEEAETLQKFINTVDAARQRGVTFLRIEKPWNAREQLLFKAGFERYESKARQIYCELTNFTLEFIKSAEKKELETACKNLGFIIPRRNTVIDYELIRSILKDFLNS